jgi:hypothetical protein
MLNVAIKAKEAEIARRKLCRRPLPTETVGPEALVDLARLLARQAACEIYRNNTGDITPAGGDPV